MQAEKVEKRQRFHQAKEQAFLRHGIAGKPGQPKQRPLGDPLMDEY
jgi:hypothetical protein